MVRTGINLNDKDIGLLAHSWHSCSQLVRNLTRMRNELSNDPTHHLEESNTRIQADNSDRRKLRERQYQCIGRFDPSATDFGRFDPSATDFATVFIIASGNLTAASLHVKNALQIGKAYTEAYENKFPQGFYNKISSHVVIMDTPMKRINTGAVITVDIYVIFNRTLGIIGSDEFDLPDLFYHELAPIPTSLFIDDGSMILGSSK